MYIYESHLGGLFTSEEYLNDNDLYCEQCGDWDNLIGEASNIEEAKKIINYDAFYDKEYINNFLEEEFCENRQHI